MAVIKKLDPVTINHIAAGEVVERPASVVKELIDNSLDSGATQILVSIRNGGISEIEVSDNGGGMTEEDARHCLLSHFTSKITTIDDLETITTMGFRGEALPSIASISRLRLRTREPGAESGYEIKAEGGKIIAANPCACPEGTVVTVNDLFYNTPARYKFLKKDSLEAGYIADTIGKLALTRPDVSFRLINEAGKSILYTPGNNDLLSAIYAVFDRKTAEGMIPFENNRPPVLLSGYISTPENARGNRARQVFIVNGRNINSRILSIAIDESIRGWFVKSRFPALVMQINIPQELVDINVHPQKSELRFWQEKEVFSAVYHTIQNALASASGIPSVLESSKDQMQSVLSASVGSERKSSTSTDIDAIVDSADEKEQQRHEKLSDKSFSSTKTQSILFNDNEVKNKQISYSDILPDPLDENITMPLTQTETQPDLPEQVSSGQISLEHLDITGIQNARIIGVYANTYILLEMKGELVIIDQHAAHERILFEELLSKEPNQERKMPSQLLLKPLKMKITQLEFAAVTEYREQIVQLGFDFEDFGVDSIVIRAVPEVRSELNPELAFSAVIEACVNENIKFANGRQDLLHDIACKAAVKAHDRLDHLEIKRLLTDLQNLDNPYHCPHGRPVLIRFSRHDLDKMFKRIMG